MSTAAMIRWGGLSYLLAGVSLILQQGYELVDATHSSTWVALHVIGYIGLGLGIVCLFAVMAVQLEHLSGMGRLGFILGALGNALTGGAAFLNAFVVPVAPDLAKTTGPIFTGPAAGVILVAALLVTVGFVLFGIATLRAGVLPQWAA